MSDISKCDRCGKNKRNVERVPTSSQLLFGGFPVQTERRCLPCERDMAAWVDRMMCVDYGFPPAKSEESVI